MHIYIYVHIYIYIYIYIYQIENNRLYLKENIKLFVNKLTNLLSTHLNAIDASILRKAFQSRPIQQTNLVTFAKKQQS